MTASSSQNEPLLKCVVTQMSSVKAFMRGLMAQPESVASVIPSSSFLKDQLRAIPELSEAKTVVELGPGTGGTTKSILGNLRADGKLLTIEIVPEFVQQLQLIDDPRLIVHEGDASDLREIVAQHSLDAPEVVISGIPFSTMSPEAAFNTITAVYQSLAPHGIFVAYQFRDRISNYANPIFGEPEVQFVLWNVPPLRLYRWTKAA
jgi:phospholipid N-methyltransferase